METTIETSQMLDSTRLPSGANQRLRILVTDGFNTAYAVRMVTIANALTVLGTLPGPDVTGVAVNTTTQAFFASDVLSATVNPNAFQVYENAFLPIQAAVHYDAANRTAVFTPDQQ